MYVCICKLHAYPTHLCMLFIVLCVCAAQARNIFTLVVFGCDERRKKSAYFAFDAISLPSFTPGGRVAGFRREGKEKF